MLLLLLPLLTATPEEAARACAAQESRLTAQRAAVWSALEGHHRAAARYHAALEVLPAWATPGQQEAHARAQAEAFAAMTRAASVLRMVQAGAAITAREVAAAKVRLGCPGVEDSGG